MSDVDAYRTFILGAEPRDLMHQLNLDLKDPLTSAQALVDMLVMLQNPSPGLRRKVDSGEINAAEILQQLSGNLTRALDVIDFYRETLGVE